MSVVSPDVAPQQNEAARQLAADQQRYADLLAAEQARLSSQRASESAEYDRQYQALVAAGQAALDTNHDWAIGQLQKADQLAWDHRTAISQQADKDAAAAQNAAQTAFNTEKNAALDDKQKTAAALVKQQNDALALQNAQMEARQRAAGSQQYDSAALLEHMRQSQMDVEAQRAAAAAAAEAAAKKRAEEARAYATGRQDLIKGYQTSVDQSFAGFDDNYFNDFAKTFVDTYKPDLEREYEGQRKQTLYGFANAGNLNSTAAAEQFANLDRNKSKAEGQLASKAVDQAGRYRGDVATQKANTLSTLFSSGAVGADTLPEGDQASAALGDISTRTGAMSAALPAMTAGLQGGTNYLGYNATIDGVTLPNNKNSQTSLASALSGIKVNSPNAASGYVVS